jgi:hypothetical protein
MLDYFRTTGERRPRISLLMLSASEPEADANQCGEQGSELKAGNVALPSRRISDFTFKRFLSRGNIYSDGLATAPLAITDMLKRASLSMVSESDELSSNGVFGML